MRIIVVALFACIVAVILTAPHAPNPNPVPTATVAAADATLPPTQDCMNAVTGADGYAPPTQECLSSM